MPDGLNLVADWFDLAKPYFETDPVDNAYRIMGQVRHIGVELSLSGQVAKGVKLVAGSVLLAPKVSGAAVDEGRLGARPIGRTSTLVDGSIDWRLGQGRSRWSLDMRVLYEGQREADARNRFSIPARTTLDLGARYRFKLGKSDAPRQAGQCHECLWLARHQRRRLSHQYPSQSIRGADRGFLICQAA